MARGIPDPNTPQYLKMERRVRYLENTVAKRNKEQARKIIQLEKHIKNQDIIIAEQAKTIQDLKLMVEELRRMVFGQKKNKNNEPDPDDNQGGESRENKASRLPSSFRRPIPNDDEVTAQTNHPLVDCSDCGRPLNNIKTVIRYKEDIVLPQVKTVEKQYIETGWCRNCHNQRSALPLPPQIVTLGPNVKHFVLYSTYVLKLSYQETRDVLIDVYQIKVSDGEISNILEASAGKLQPTYENLKTSIRDGPGIHLDETGWPEQGERTFAWVMTPTNGESAVFSVGKTRGKGNAESLLGNSQAVRITDCYSAYKNIPGKHQVCWAHIQRTAKDLARSEYLTEEQKSICINFYHQISALYKEIRMIKDEPLDQEQRQNHHLKLLYKINQLAVINEGTHSPKKLIDLKRRLATYRNQLLTCILIPGISPDNNQAERKLRHLVLKRRRSFGTKTDKGSRVFEINASVLLSQWWTDRTKWFQNTRALLG
jgi:transposase